MRRYKDLILDEFQARACDLIDQNISVLVAAPTGSGKTLVADYVIDKTIREGRAVVYTAPVKALSNQKYRDFRRSYGDEAVGILTGDVSINPAAPVMVMTTEIFRNVLLTEPARVGNIAWIIFDEIHYLDDIDRGTVWEESIMLKPPHLRLLALSATVPNAGSIAGWIKKLHNEPMEVIREEKRPVPLSFSYQCANRIYYSQEKLAASGCMHADETQIKRTRWDRNSSMHVRKNRIDSLFHSIEERRQFPVIYFSFSRKKCEMLAGELIRFEFLTETERQTLVAEYDRLVAAFEIQKERSAEYMREFVERGIAYHHAGLLPTLKEIVEQLFSRRLIKVIFTTETFALGVNMPARCVVFDDVRKFYGGFHANLKTRDLYQMAGRAGRRGIDEHGDVIIRVNPLYLSMSELNRIVNGKTEPVLSQFSSNYATILNLYKDMGEKIYDIYPLSFHFYQSSGKDKKYALKLLKSKLSLLKDMGYIISEKELSWKGELASRCYSYELQLGELFEQGMLVPLSARDLSAVVAALVYEPRKGIIPPPVPKAMRSIKKAMDNVLREINRREKYFGVFPAAKRFSFHLSLSMYKWFDGDSFEDILENTDFDEGEVVRYFRMSVQVLRELKSFEGIDAEFKRKINEALDRINRDVIDAEKQLRQEL